MANRCYRTQFELLEARAFFSHLDLGLGKVSRIVVAVFKETVLTPFPLQLFPYLVD